MFKTHMRGDDRTEEGPMSICGTWLSHAGARIARIAFAQDCLLCGAASDDAVLCVPCRNDLPGLPAGCPVCAMPGAPGETCGTCLRHPPRFDVTYAAWRYAYPADRLVHALKFHGRLALSQFFACALASRVTRVDVVIPMPLHASRLAERGFNQAVEIARQFPADISARVVPRGATRIRPTRPQADLPLAQRSRNVRGAFACDVDLTGARVAVVDDVMTTGATLDELAGALKRAGAARVENWVVARTLG
jgi:ComF family protein